MFIFRFLSTGKPFSSKTNSLIHSGKDFVESTLQVLKVLTYCKLIHYNLTKCSFSKLIF